MSSLTIPFFFYSQILVARDKDYFTEHEKPYHKDNVFLKCVYLDFDNFNLNCYCQGLKEKRVFFIPLYQNF